MVIQPTLVLGIGGIGGRILSALSTRLPEEDRKLVATILLDTNVNDLKSAKNSGKVDYTVQISEEYKVSEFVERLKNQGEDTDLWFHKIPIVQDSTLLEGAGQIRQKSRLALLAAKRSGKLGSIVTALENVNSAFSNGDSNGDMQTPVNIYIVGSIAGGTCAGTMVQMPYVIRQLMKERGINKTVKIKGLFIGPTVTLGYQDGFPEKIRDTFSNAYACVKEINGLYRFASYDMKKIPIKIEGYEPHRTAYNSDVNQIPYDFIFLIDRNGLTGQTLCPDAVPKDYEGMAVNILQAQLSQVGSTAAGAEDNLISLQVGTEGMARFCGSGAFTVDYPLEGIEEYVALRCAADNIGSTWRRIDEDFNRERRQRNQRLLENSNEKPLEFESFYIRKFDEYSGKDSSDMFFRSLAQELQIVKTEKGPEAETSNSLIEGLDGSNSTDANNVVNDAYKSIKELIKKDAYENEIVREKKGECESYLSIEQIKAIINAHKNVEEILSGVQRYINAARECLSLSYDTSSKIMSVENVSKEEGLTPAWIMNKEHYNVFMAIREKHPLVARYILLKLRAYMMACLEEDLKKEQEREENLFIFADRDFDDSQNGIQTAEEVLNAIMKNSNRKQGLFNRSKGTKGVDEFAETFSTTLRDQVRIIDEYLLAAYRKRVFQDVLKKINSLIKTYNLLFDSLPAMVNELSNSVMKQETAHNEENERVCRYAFARGDHKKIAYRTVSLAAETQVLSETTKATFAEALYGLFTGYYYSSLNANSQLKRKQEERLAKNTAKLFESKILPDIKADTTSTVKKFFDKGVVNALRYEVVCDDLLKEYDGDLEASAYDLRDQIESSVTFALSEKQEEKLRNIIWNEVVNKAGPFISVNQMELRLSLYWGVNPEIASFGVNKGYVETLLRPAVGMIVEDSSFSKNQLICYRLLYGVQAFELNSYNRESEAYRHYSSKVKDVVIDQKKRALRKDKIDAAFSPHLDKRWHKEFYLPDIDPKREDENRANDFFSTAYLLSSGRVFLSEYDGSYRWKTTLFGLSEEIMIESLPARSTLTDLYRSLPHNPLIKDKAIELFKAAQEKDLQDEVDIEKNIGRHSLIKVFTEIPYVTESVNDATKMISIFDLLAVLKPSFDEEWYIKTFSSIKHYIDAYCEKASISTGVYGQQQKLYRQVMQLLVEKTDLKNVELLELNNSNMLEI